MSEGKCEDSCKFHIVCIAGADDLLKNIMFIGGDKLISKEGHKLSTTAVSK